MNVFKVYLYSYKVRLLDKLLSMLQLMWLLIHHL